MSEFLKPGQIFENRYEILGVLGSGGVGTVYRARQLDADRFVALKILHLAFARDEEFKLRFLREAQALHRLAHNNIVNIYHMGLAGSGQPYQSMELLEGKSGRQLLNELDRLPSWRALRIVRDAARALHYVHEHEIVHRDLKPENMILLDQPEADTVKIIDFGLARVQDDSNQKLTQTGALLGTASYMSPEQAKGLKADRRSDIYALGACLYEFLTGQKCYEADTAVGLIYKHLTEPAPTIVASMVERYVPSLNKLIARSMDKDPDKRFQSMDEMSDAIETVLDELEDLAPERRSAVSLLALFAAMLVVLGLGLAVMQKEQARSLNKSGTAVRNKKNETVVPPDQVHIPFDYSNLCRLQNVYGTKMGTQAGIIISKRWLNIHAAKAAAEDRVAVYADLARQYSQLLNQANAELYANKVFAYKRAEDNAVAVAVSLANMYKRTGQREKGIALIEKIRVTYPDFRRGTDGSQLEADVGNWLLEEHDYERAVNLLEVAEKENLKFRGARASDNPYRLALITALAKLGRNADVSKVINTCELAVEQSNRMIDETSKAAIADRNESKEDLYQSVATALFRGDDFEQGAKYFELAGQLYERKGRFKEAVDCSINVALATMELHQFGRAMEVCKQALKHCHEWEKRAQVLTLLSRSSEVVKDMKSATDYAQESLACFLEHFRQVKGGFSSYQDSVYVESVRHLCDLLVAQGRPQEAERLLNEWIARFESKRPDSYPLVSCYDRKILMFIIEKRFPEALEIIRKEIEILKKPEVQKNWILYGVKTGSFLADAYANESQLLQSLGQTNEAAQAARQGMKCLENKKDFSFGERVSRLLMMAYCFFNCGKREEAAACYATTELCLAKPETGSELLTADLMCQLSNARYGQLGGSRSLPIN